MPVTAKLSQALYEKLGERPTNALVDWLNAVDEDYRGQLRNLNELNFARFDAKVDQRFAEMDVRIEHRFATFEIKWEKRFTDLEASIDHRFTDLEASIDHCFAEMDVRIERRCAALDVRLASFEARMMRWMLVFWTGTTLSVLGVAYVALKR